MTNKAFLLLHPDVQRVIHRQGWKELRPIQVAAFKHFYETRHDGLLSAATAEGKTEALIGPILSEIRTNPKSSIQCLYIAPLKALINNLDERITRLAEPLEILVTAWHGDIPQSRKEKLRKNPSGLAIITPESIESLLTNHGGDAARMFAHLDFVIVDEIHSLLDRERGVHVQSLLARIFSMINHRPRVFGLSATLADVRPAQSFLNLDNPDSVIVIRDDDRRRDIQVGVMAYLDDTRRAVEADSGHNPSLLKTTDPLEEIVSDIAAEFGGSSKLVFFNSRPVLETAADTFQEFAKANGHDIPLYCHHAAISKILREEAERAVKSGRPVLVFCTSTFELGLDVGFISAVCQVDPPATVNSLVQRTGRSGRSGEEPSILRFYVVDLAPMKGASLTQLLYPNLLQTTAMIRLMIEGWLEPATGDRYNLSTLTHQVLSLLKERSELKPSAIYEILCQTGPFRKVDQRLFEDVLRSLKKHELIEQEPEGKILLGSLGERITGAFDFYAAFLTKVEYSVRHRGEAIGLLPADFLPRLGEHFNLAGRRWRVETIDHTNQVVEVSPAGVSKAPVFRNPAGDVHTRVFREMQAVLQDTTLPAYLNPKAQSLLQAARRAAESAGLIHSNVLVGSSGVLWFPWVGTEGQRTLELFAAKAKLKCVRDRLSLAFPGQSAEQFKGFLNSVVPQPVDPVELAALMVQKRFEKFDRYLEPKILDQANAHDRLNVEDARQAAAAALAELEGGDSQASPK